MSEMIERVARAMCREWLEMDYEGENVDHLVEREWSGWAYIAQTAIAAMMQSIPHLTDEQHALIKAALAE